MANYDLTISMDYVPTWGVVEAVRELFQNAVDNEKKQPENKMFFSYEGNALRIGNKTSVLTLDTLLIGNSSKRDDEETIGQHGEGYKIAFMVLLREGKKVTVYNYGNKEVWNTKVVKARRFNGANVPRITVDKKHLWERVPDHDLVIEVEGITGEEYALIVQKNLNLREYNKYGDLEHGEVLLDASEKGNIYVSGLFVCKNDTVQFGYNFPANRIKLDRDRQLVDTIHILFETSTLWAHLEGKEDMVGKMLTNNIPDVKYLEYEYINKESQKKIQIKAVEEFKSQYGEDAVPVVTNEQLKVVVDAGKQTPVMVSSSAYKYMGSAFSYYSKPVVLDKDKKVSEQLKELKEEIRGVLSDRQKESLELLIAEVEKYETIEEEKNKELSEMEEKIKRVESSKKELEKELNKYKSKEELRGKRSKLRK